MSADRGDWIPTSTFAELAQISERSARRIAQKAATGRASRGHSLIVRVSEGRGGRSGIVFEIATKSLPAELRAKFEESHCAVVPFESSVMTSAASTVSPSRRLSASQWLELLKPAVAARNDGRPVDPVLRRLAPPDGRYPTFETIRKKFQSLSNGDARALQPKRRSDTAAQHVVISRRWDAATLQLSEGTRTAIRDALINDCRSLYAEIGHSRNEVARLATVRLIELTRAAGVRMTDAEALFACAVPPHFARRHRRFGKLAVKRYDAKRWHDEYQTRIRRRRPAFPMQYVAADCHHCDLYFEDANGRLSTPKIIAFLDIATWRLFAKVLFMPPGRMIRGEDVAEACCAMIEEWGLFEHLYLDNGGEFGKWTELISDAMQLCQSLTGRSGVAPLVRPPILRSLPYRPTGKVIEGAFSRLERGALRLLPGHIGGNRLQSKAATLGQGPNRFTGGSAEFFASIIYEAIRYYNGTALTSGELKGKSPQGAYEALLGDWGPTTINPCELKALFARDVFPKVRGAVVTIDGEEYSAPELGAYSGELVHVRVPLFGRRDQLLVLDKETRTPICAAAARTIHAFDDPEGPKEFSRLSHAQSEAMTDLASQVEPVNLVERMRGHNALQPPPPLAAPRAKIMISDSVTQQGAAIAAFPGRRAAKDRAAEAHRKRGAALAEFARLLAEKK